MRRYPHVQVVLAVLTAVMLALALGCASEQPTPTAVDIPATIAAGVATRIATQPPTLRPTVTPQPTATVRPTAVMSPSPTPPLEPTATQEPTATPTVTPTPTPTPDPTPTPEPTATPLPTHTPAPTATPTPSPTPVPALEYLFDIPESRILTVADLEGKSTAWLEEGPLLLTGSYVGLTDSRYGDSWKTFSLDGRFSENRYMANVTGFDSPPTQEGRYQMVVQYVDEEEFCYYTGILAPPPGFCFNGWTQVTPDFRLVNADAVRWTSPSSYAGPPRD